MAGAGSFPPFCSRRIGGLLCHRADLGCLGCGTTCSEDRSVTTAGIQSGKRVNAEEAKTFGRSQNLNPLIPTLGTTGRVSRLNQSLNGFVSYTVLFCLIGMILSRFKAVLSTMTSLPAEVRIKGTAGGESPEDHSEEVYSKSVQCHQLQHTGVDMSN